MSNWFWLTASYGFGSMLVYFMVVRMMIVRWKEYNSTFFRIFIAEFFFNIITFLNSYITLRLPQNTGKTCFLAKFFDSQATPTSDAFPLHIFFTIHYSMAFIQYSMIFLLSLNRLSMVVLVTTYEKYWRPSLFWILVVIVIFPLTQTWQILTHSAYYLYVETMGGYTTKTDVDVSGILDVLLWFMGIVTALTILVNTISIIRIYCLSEKIGISGAEKHLFWVSFVSFGIQCFAAADTFILRFAVSDINRTSYGAQLAAALMPIASDLLTLSHPWTLLYFSNKVRLGMLNFYYPQWRKIQIASTASSIY